VCWLLAIFFLIDSISLMLQTPSTSYLKQMKNEK